MPRDDRFPFPPPPFPRAGGAELPQTEARALAALFRRSAAQASWGDPLPQNAERDGRMARLAQALVAAPGAAERARALGAFMAESAHIARPAAERGADPMQAIVGSGWAMPFELSLAGQWLHAIHTGSEAALPGAVPPRPAEPSDPAALAVAEAFHRRFAPLSTSVGPGFTAETLGAVVANVEAAFDFLRRAFGHEPSFASFRVDFSDKLSGPPGAYDERHDEIVFGPECADPAVGPRVVVHEYTHRVQCALNAASGGGLFRAVGGTPFRAILAELSRPSPDRAADLAAWADACLPPAEAALLSAVLADPDPKGAAKASLQFDRLARASLPAPLARMASDLASALRQNPDLAFPEAQEAAFLASFGDRSVSLDLERHARFVEIQMAAELGLPCPASPPHPPLRSVSPEALERIGEFNRFAYALHDELGAGALRAADIAVWGPELAEARSPWGPLEPPARAPRRRA